MAGNARVGTMGSWKEKTAKRAIAVLVTLIGLAQAACQPPFDDVLVNSDGDQIRLTLVDSIVNDPDLTDAEKRDVLHAAGIDDENLIDYLLAANLP
jgi:hypothetical protein